MKPISKYKNHGVIFGASILLLACSGTPNNVTMTPNQGTCVQLNQYASNVQASVAAAFPFLESNPTIPTPYCMAVTIQNNNTGNNANNIQITNNGVQVTTTIPGSASATTVTLYDYYASNVGGITGESQILNNVAMFDPNNCATTSGANVKTISTGGGLCTFYLEILNESSTVGVYPYSITYNYTNGNQNYSTNSSINQRVYLYGGDNFSPGLYYMSTNVLSASASPTTTTPVWQTGIPNATTTTPVQYVMEGQFGFVDFAAGSSVYYFNGITTTQIGTTLPISPNVVTSLAYDASGNLYAATNGSGIWVYNISATNPNWVQMTANSGITATSNIIAMKGYEFSTSPNVLYEITDLEVYACTPNATNATESCTVSISSGKPSRFFSNSADVDTTGNLYTGGVTSGLLSVSALSSNLLSWIQYVMSPSYPYSSDVTKVGGVRWTNLNGTTNLYFGLVNESSSESTVYSCIGTSCTPLLSTSSNPISGNANTITTDGVGSLYVAGSNLFSSDYQGSGVTSATGAFLLFGIYTVSGIGSGTWTPILPIESLSVPIQINTTAVASMLTTY